jgi:hypothetical protein
VWQISIETFSNMCATENDEDELAGFLPYYNWNALVDLEKLCCEGGDPEGKRKVD